MFLLPISHDRFDFRRLPLATIALAGICLVVFALQVWIDRAALPEIELRFEDAGRYFEKHPWLEPHGPLRRVWTGPRSAVPAALSADQLAAQQAELDARADALVDALRHLSAQRFGHVPARGGLLTALTCVFLHGSVFHLLGNLWFSVLIGMTLEERWGRAAYAAFFVVAGVAASLLDAAVDPSSLVPRIGASGAIAAGMGAFLVTNAGARIHFFYWFVTRTGVFPAPAYVVLPLWAANETWNAISATGTGIAHAAHVAGFGVGALLALVVRRTGVDDKLMAETDQAAEDAADLRAIREAPDLASHGRVRDARASLEEILERRPGHLPALEASIALTRAVGDVDGEARFLSLDLGARLRAGDVAGASRDLDALDRLPFRRTIDPEQRLAVAEALARSGDDAASDRTLDPVLAGGLADAAAVRATLLRARLRERAGKSDEARALYEEVLTSPYATVDTDQRAEAALERIARAG